MIHQHLFTRTLVVAMSRFGFVLPLLLTAISALSLVLTPARAQAQPQRPIITNVTPAQEPRNMFGAPGTPATNAPRSSTGNLTVTADINPRQLQPGQTGLYSITISAGSGVSGNASRDLPQLPDGLSWVPGSVSQSQSTELINGDMTQTFRLTVGITASKQGKFTIPAPSATLNGQRIVGNAVDVTVSTAPPPQPATDLPAELQGNVVPPEVPNNPQMVRQLTGAVFILPVLEPKELYEGQQARLSFHLCLDMAALQRAGISQPIPSQAMQPPLRQFLKEVEFDANRIRFSERSFGNRTYQVAPLYSVLIVPTRTGKLTIEPFKLNLQMRKRGGGGMPMSPFDDTDIFDDPMLAQMGIAVPGARGGFQAVALSPEVTVDVKPLPTAGRPANFAGAVGDFKIAADVDKRAAMVGEDTVELHVNIEGKGDAGSIPPPKIPAIDGLNVLGDPTAVTETQRNGDISITRKRLTYKLRAEKPGTIRIPPFTLSEFDPNAKKYQTVKSEPIELAAVANPHKAAAPLVAGSPSPAAEQNSGISITDATPAGAGAAGTGGADAVTSGGADTSSPARQLADDLRYIHVAPLTIVEAGALTGETTGFYGLLAIPPALLLAGWIAGRRRQARAERPDRYREAGAAASARKRLRRAHRLMSGQDTTPFYTELASAMRGFFGDRFHLNAADLTVEQIEDQLRAREAPEEDITAVRQLLDQCDQARYAPIRTDSAVQQHAYDTAASLLSRLEKLRK